jgi:hypothetical protein
MENVILDPTQDPEIFENAYKNRSLPVDWKRAYQGYTAAVDWPTAAFFDQLYTLNPDAKIILTVRTPESWFQSVSKTIHEWPNVDDTWPENITKARKMARVIVRDGELGRAQTLFERKQELLDKFVNHIDYIKKIVPEKNLLVLDVAEEDKWEKLCAFLGIEQVPTIPYPHDNKGDNFGNMLLEIKELSIGRMTQQLEIASSIATADVAQKSQAS